MDKTYLKEDYSHDIQQEKPQAVIDAIKDALNMINLQ
jgi:hypothetical protein